MSKVEVTSPPITTVARGRWTSDPMPVESSRGINPRLATVAVIITGRRRQHGSPFDKNAEESNQRGTASSGRSSTVTRFSRISPSRRISSVIVRPIPERYSHF